MNQFPYIRTAIHGCAHIHVRIDTYTRTWAPRFLLWAMKLIEGLLKRTPFRGSHTDIRARSYVGVQYVVNLAIHCIWDIRFNRIENMTSLDAIGMMSLGYASIQLLECIESIVNHAGLLWSDSIESWKTSRICLLDRHISWQPHFSMLAAYNHFSCMTTE